MTNTINNTSAAMNYVAATLNNASTQMRERIQDLVVMREAFESTHLARSNQALYGLMTDCLSLYRDLTEGDKLKEKKLGLQDFINLKGYVFKATSPLSLKVIRCIFGDKDRRRISTYHTVLRVAITEKWTLTEVATKIAERGGVQEISVRKGESMSQKDKVTTAQATLLNQSIAVIDSKQVIDAINIEKKQEQAVAVLTQKDDGTFDVHCIVHSSIAVNAALAAYFNANKTELQQVVAQQKAIEVAAQQAALIATAAKAANDINATAAA